MALEPVMTFTSPTRGRLDFDTLFYDIINYMQEAPDSRYRVIIGTDSQFAEETCFVTAIIVHREGKGARYYYTREKERVGRSLRQRIYYETSARSGRKPPHGTTGGKRLRRLKRRDSSRRRRERADEGAHPRSGRHGRRLRL